MFVVVVFYMTLRSGEVKVMDWEFVWEDSLEESIYILIPLVSYDTNSPPTFP